MRVAEGMRQERAGHCWWRCHDPLALLVPIGIVIGRVPCVAVVDVTVLMGLVTTIAVLLEVL